MNRRDLSIISGAHTHAGMRRAVNEDAVLVADPFYLVADGVGGQEGGARASRAALSAFEHSAVPGEAASLDGVEQSITRARAAVQRVRDSGAPQAGSTLTGLIRIQHDGSPQWYVLNIGDSRVYLWREGRLVQLTADHSLQAELAAAGDPGAPLAPSNVITRALGAENDRHDSWLLPPEAGSRLVVCSDGLTGEVSDEEIEHVLATIVPAQEAATKLLTMALEAGGRDNVTIIVVDVHANIISALGEEHETTIEQ